ncbi:MAG: type II toxin-antitoxin system RelE/ParE family toxin [Alphaproteobacteria bacterium]|nr:type II toxin-antitoxin system RelE/ParE family toxin [Alphaproteobacteria bacterium]
MRVFKNQWFNRWARRGEGISDAGLCAAAADVVDGNVEADLGGYLFKKRVARARGGKSGG